ncbi:MAG: helix-turn-helix transcriptional regulator [Prevotella sp.]|nr:helix-turn-helix transcriptional regulator [Staphylococcus sp.]MCM1349578.1 helix-turn-helix transcriptional regulator [Prevotella sp.]
MNNISFNNTTNYLTYQKMMMNALKYYMIDNSISISQLSKDTSLSSSTIRSILNGKLFSYYSLIKLFTLGENFISYFKLD